MNATETAVETIYKAMGYRRCGMDHYVNHQECQRIYDPRLRRNRDGTYGGDCLRWDWPDPLADTPEGWWEFGQILEWAEDKWPEYKPEIVRGSLYWYVDGGVRTAQSKSFRAAFIEALAEAVGGQGESMKEARE